MVWLRLVTSAVVLAADRPAGAARAVRQDWLVVLGFGATLGLMNWAIYQSFARIPLGIAVTIEFIGPLTLAVHRLPAAARPGVGGARRRSGCALLGFEPPTWTWPASLFALLAGAAWAAYILLSAQTGRRWPGLDGLAIASVVATLLLTPAVAGPAATRLATRGSCCSAPRSGCSAR